MKAVKRIEYNEQGYINTKPDKPIIASRPFDPTAVVSFEGAMNAWRMAEFHARWRAQSEPVLQIWRG